MAFPLPSSLVSPSAFCSFGASAESSDGMDRPFVLSYCGIELLVLGSVLVVEQTSCLSPLDFIDDEAISELFPATTLSDGGPLFISSLRSSVEVS